MINSTRGITLGCLTLLILLAGCSGLPVTQPAAESNTPLETVTYPEGWSADSVDAITAHSTHREALSGQPRKSRIEITDDDGNRTVIRAVDPNAETGKIRFVDSTLSIDTETYYTQAGIHEYDHTTGELTTPEEASWNASEVGFQASNTIIRPLRNLNITATEATQTANTTAINYTVKGLADASFSPPTNATGHIVVTETGSITAFDISKSNEDYTRRYRYNLQTDSVKITEPSWLASSS